MFSKKVNDSNSIEKMKIRSKISDVMIFDMKFRKIDIEFIAKIEKNDDFIKINKHVFELFFEQNE